nr:TadE/TadG family type IV pilus assembly protein [Streptomyces sp. S1D4-11]QIZ01506.1 hypothetical protein HEP87_11165 [Streptomyces sp. S1D4-11]
MRLPTQPRRSQDAGSATTELVLVTPLLILLALVAVAFGKLVGARLDADEAAHQAARAASLARSADEARAEVAGRPRAAWPGPDPRAPAPGSPLRWATSSPGVWCG